MPPNLLAIPREAGPDRPEELFETLLSGPDGLVVERIVSHGQTTPEGSWYDQPHDEWVAVLEGAARLAYEDGSEVLLEKGDQLFLPRRRKHRVTWTSSPCLWLAIHGALDWTGEKT